MRYPRNHNKQKSPVLLSNSNRDRFVKLTKWQSLGLMMNKKKVWLSYCTNHKNKGKLLFDVSSMKKLSIKFQIKNILYLYGWIPNELHYQTIKSSMKISQITQYGDMVQSFVEEYNCEIQSMHLSLHQKMPHNYHSSDIVSLSRFINNTSSRSLNKLIRSIDENCLKQILINNINYYLNEKNREKYLNNINDHKHHNILKYIKHNLTKKIHKKRLKYTQNIFDTLPLDLSSYILSFCSNKSVNNAAYCCHTLYNSSQQFYSRTQITMNAQKLAAKPVLSQTEINKYYRKPSIIFNHLKQGYINRFQRYFEQIAHCANLNTLSMDNTSGTLAQRVLDVCVNNDRVNISHFNAKNYGVVQTMTLPGEILSNLTSFHVDILSGTILYEIQKLLIHNKTNVRAINVDRGDVDIVNYINKTSKLKSLIIHYEYPWYYRRDIPIQCDSSSAHPIFWLWNVPTLESAEVSLSFKKQTDFRKECNKMLSCSIMTQTAKQQRLFKELTLKIHNDWDVDDWQNVFLWIPKLYPNLTRLTYYELTSKLSKYLDWSLCFGDLEYIKINISMTMDIAMDLLDTIQRRKNKSFRNLQVLRLDAIECPYKNNKDSDINTWKLKHFIHQIRCFLDVRPSNLISVALIVSYSYCRYDDLLDPIKNYMKMVLDIMKMNHAFDGYLEFGSAKPWSLFDWNEYRKNESLEISQIISKIQMEMKNNDDSKLIVRLVGLQLYDEHIEFLKFWFSDDLFETGKHQNRNYVKFVA